jgi:hypothetical protein
VHPLVWAGQSVSDKLAELRRQLVEAGAGALLVTMLGALWLMLPCGQRSQRVLVSGCSSCCAWQHPGPPMLCEQLTPLLSTGLLSCR